MKKILVTGGLGFIGSHTCVELHHAGYEPIILDNLSNSKIEILDKLLEITGKKFSFYKGDCNDADLLDEIFTQHSCDGVIHFAAYKAVGESVEKPIDYYQNNINSLLTVLSKAEHYSCRHIVFSSSCTVYGQPETLPVTESSPIQKAESPYGSTKIMCEQILEDFIHASSKSKAVSLRYFNPIGAHESGLIGELPLGTPNNLVPFITQTAAGIREQLTVFGDDYDTPDGSCIRDYIHVVDLAKAHVKSIEFLEKSADQTIEAINVGTGKGNSVLEVINSFEEVTGVKLNYKIGDKRSGDVVSVYGDVKKSKNLLQWEAQFDIKRALSDAWKWQTNIGKG